MQPSDDPDTTAPAGEPVDFLSGIVLPLPDENAAAAARDRLSSIDIGVCAPTISGLGMLAEAVVFIAGVQASPYPRPLLSTRVVLVTGSHAGGVVAGPAPDPRNGTPLQHLAVGVGAGIVTLEWQPASAAIEFEDAITLDQMNVALRSGWAEAERAADEGIELLVLAAGGPGAASAAVAVTSAITGYEATALLGRVVTPAGYYDDGAWMARCLALRDAMHRVRHRSGDARTVLAALGGADIAAAAGLVLGAASRRLPIMIDGPVGAAAALIANDFAPQSRRWIMLPDSGRHQAVLAAAEALELRPWLDLCLDLGEGATALAALPLLQMALTLAGAGEPVEAAPFTRVDATGGQIFVGVARPVEPAEGPEDAPEPETAGAKPKAAKDAIPTGVMAKAMDKAGSAANVDAAAKAGATPAKSIGAKAAAKGPAKPAPPKTTPAKAAPGKAPAPKPAKAAAARQAPPKVARPAAPAAPAQATAPAGTPEAKPAPAAPAKRDEPASSAAGQVTPDKGAEKPADKLADKGAEKPAEKPADKPAEKPADKSVEEPAERAAEGEPVPAGG